MPFRLKKCRGKDLYWVITTDTGKKHSIEPLPKERAEAQMKALYINTMNEIKPKVDGYKSNSH
jgi:hypothetical protein